MSSSLSSSNNMAAATTDAANSNTNNNIKIITEGSAQMAVPSDNNDNNKQSVFYNPVQVQNRDLSILMITLAVERRAIRHAVHKKRQELKKKKKNNTNSTNEQQQEKDSSSSSSSIPQLLKDYEATLNGRNLVLEQQQESKDKCNGITVLDALAASGLRSIRYWKEIAGIKHVCINDLESVAVTRALDNISRNDLNDVLITTKSSNDDTKDKDEDDPRPYGIRVQHGDAVIEMHQSRKPPLLQSHPGIDPPSYTDFLKPQYDIIDLDPYGSAAAFLDSAVQAVCDGGMLCVTCTDMRTLGGSAPDTCFGRYSSMPVKGGYLQEGAVRILLYSLASTAAKYGRTIKPILSVGMDFYVRCFVEINNDKNGVSQLSLNIGHVYQSTQCPSFHIVPVGQLGGKKGNVYQPGRIHQHTACEETGSALKVGGPLWLGPLHDVDVVEQALERLKSTSSNNKSASSSSPNLELLATRIRLQGLLESCRDEISDGAPLYYKCSDLAQTLHVSAPPHQKVQAALINAGYRVSGYHKEPLAIKTDAPARIVWDIFRAWYKQHPPNKAPVEGSAAAKIIAVEPSIEVDFTIPESLLEPKKKKKSDVSRFPKNPEPHWGPKPKASGQKRKAEGNIDN